MAQKEFKAESKRLLEMMVNSIYSQKEIFLRELISNASDAIDKMYYRTLTDESLSFNQDDFYIKVTADKEARTLTIVDTGIGMNEAELEENLGTIARSGSLAFKQQNEAKDGHDIIGQFGVGFYSAFMVADRVTVVTKSADSSQAFRWESNGTDGYTIEPTDYDAVGSTITLHLKENQEDAEESFDEYLDEQRLKQIIKKYSDFIRYPIKMDVTKYEQQEDSEETVETIEEETINSMVPIWRKNKSELTDADYENFYQEKRYGFDKPLAYEHIHVDGTIRYNSILYIPETTPFDFYSKDFEKGLELYSSGVLIMEKCPDLLPDYFSFVKGMVDSEDLSLNISREILQHDRQLQMIAKNIKSKIKSQLKKMLKNDREHYEKFFEAFGRQLKYGVYSDFGQNKEDLQDLLLFHSSKEKKLVSLADYVEAMPEEQEFIYYATGSSIDRMEKLPQAELVKDKGFELLYFTEDVDEFAIKMMREYQGKEFKSIASGDLNLESEEEKKEAEESASENKELFDEMKSLLADKVKDVRISTRLKSHPVCLTAEGEVTIEMEKILQQMPDNQGVKADKVLEINYSHEVFNSLKQTFDQDKETFKLYTNLLYNQALLIEGLPIEDPVAFTNDVSKLMK
ncbi:molecular chaperone HtpG [Paenalkalicoccus suaedae]|uniref:Chaperone protein HtpG n=1 Tax=Paenalkalicoccus suaedae TaxID=2592382 RepID=A0A859FH99_9BACI|nr:molecular chaperone HtpG [Paenalkalicoccus suaedae]QKS72441.1 molecular chaperone HtpG [Paenalkalicoccus suaedae]